MTFNNAGQQLRGDTDKHGRVVATAGQIRLHQVLELAQKLASQPLLRAEPSG